MKAMRYHSYGDSDVLVYEETDRPVAGAGQVVLKVAGAAFNPVDVPIRGGVLKDVFPVAFPHTPNYDVSGVVTETGEGVSGWSVGDAVVAFLPMTAPGAAAEYAVAPAEALVAAPLTVELADASALPSTVLTAWQSLFELAGLKPGQSVLINGAGGAVGGYAVQLAAQAGATVTATAGPRSHDRVRSYGADRIVDYTATPVLEALAGRRFDVVLNLVLNLTPSAPEEVAQLVDELVADGGVFLSTTTPVPKSPARAIRATDVFVRSDATRLADLVAQVNAGTLQIDVTSRRPLTDLPSIHDECLAGRLPGKTIVIP
ncbi:NADP-dependent oxidoreductase [Streptomyces sp. CA-111067]|uniref:NADP-dependent oxidoreductase n=1 Tax=Streptomyces sp. CA-111067 TaxID=3240046 RepID=UPI003D98C604